jgi:Ca2+-binding RTX toxin-like protein
VGFEAGIDKIALDDAVFTGLTAGALPDSAFHIGRFAGDADDRILYEAETGMLFYDPDGTGPAAASTSRLCTTVCPSRRAISW